ncbi:MAG: hypothetical protein ACO1NQ_03655 [Flavobacteriales bacterium]
MDCITSGRTVTSWFEPVSCFAPDVDGSDEHVRTNCCIFYKADAVDSPNALAERTSIPAPVDEFVFCASSCGASIPVLHAFWVHRDHGPPLVQGQRLAALGVLRV